MTYNATVPTEVENMLCAKYDYDLDIQVKQEEAFASGMKQGSRN